MRTLNTTSAAVIVVLRIPIRGYEMNIDFAKTRREQSYESL